MSNQAFSLLRSKGKFSRFLGFDHGSTLPIMAAVIIPLLGFVGLATDAARGYLIKTRLHDALDAAALAAAHEVESTEFVQQFEGFFYANFPQGYMGANVTLEPPAPSNGNRTIAYAARAQIDTTFMALLGVDTLKVSTQAEVKRATTSLDVVLSMDMSGSMAGSRISDARDAAHVMLDILYDGSETNDLLKVGLVPWSANVNVMINGSSYNSSLTQAVAVPAFTNPVTGAAQSAVYVTNVSPVPFLSQPANNWRGCVHARYEHDGEENDGDIQVGTGTYGSATPLDWVAWEHNPTASSSKCLDHGITPLIREKSAIEAAVDELTNPKSNTNIAQGLTWAWRVLSPVAPFEEADPNPKGNHQRAIVLLTDGEQTGTSQDGYQRVFGNGSSAGPAGMDARLSAVAANIKATGVKVFVIQYEFSSGPLRSLLEGVATLPTAPYYHFAPDATALEAAFEEIADELSELRLSQ